MASDRHVYPMPNTKGLGLMVSKMDTDQKHTQTEVRNKVKNVSSSS